MAGKKGRSGRKPLAKEISYLEAVKIGAPPDQVAKAVRAVLKRAQEGDARALSAVLMYLVPALTKGENMQGLDEPTRALFERFYAKVAERSRSVDETATG